MGHLNPVMILGTLGAVETALAALSARVGGYGVAAAATLLAGHPSGLAPSLDETRAAA